MHGKYACLGLLLLALAALVIIPDAAAYPSKNSACEVCHSANQPKSISISQIDIASTNVNPGQLFNVGVTWLGGNAAGSTTVKWPNVLNNNLFTINPVQVNGATSGAGSFALTAPAAHGNYTIRVYATTGPDSMETDFKELTITVQAAQPLPVLTTITVTPETAIVVQGDPQAFTAATLDQYGNPIVGTITWSSSDVAVGTVDTAGVLTAVSAGTTTVSATSGTVSASAEVTVTAPVPTPTPEPVLTTITVSPATAAVVQGNTQAFTAATLDQYGNPIVGTITWSSSDVAVGTVDTAGVLTAVSAGTTTVSATSGTVSASAEITVTEAPAVPVLTTVTISPQAPSMIEGSTVQFIATTLDQYGAAIASTVSWNSMDENVGSIDANGLFTGNFAGTTTITVTATDGAVTLSNSAIATVTSMPPVSSAMVTFIVTNTKGKPVEDAKVSMNGITRETNDDGKVVFLNVVPGVYSYKVSRNGYTAVTGNVSATGITKVPVELVKTEKKHERQDRQEIHEIED